MTTRFSSQAYPKDSRLSGWYHCLEPRPPLPRLSGRQNIDVAIVGAGFAGLSAALRLSENQPSLSIAILEAQRLAWAGGGRNSGFMIDLPHELNSDNYASAAQRDLQQIRENRLAIAFAEQAVNKFKLHAFFQRTGKYHAATNGAGLKALHSFACHLDKLNEAHEVLDSKQLQAVIGSDYYDGGIYTPGAALIQPAGYIQGLGYALDAHENISVFEQSPVTAIEAESDGVTVTTEHGQLDAASVILANNGYIEGFGIAKNRLLHLFTYASMSEELNDAQLRSLGEAPHWGLIPASPMGTTLRKLDNRRLLIRNQWTYNPNIATSDKAIDHWGRQHDACLARRYPLLKGVNMQYRWAGPIAISLNSTPVFGKVADNVYAAAVCQGLGTTKSTLYGMMLADKLSGRDSDVLRALEQQPPPSRLPPPILTKTGVPAYLKWTHWRAGRDL